jgi:starch synthase
MILSKSGFDDLRIAHFSSEVSPDSKTGGLADVTGTLPIAQAELGCQTAIVSPKYLGIKSSADHGGYCIDVRNGVKFIFIKNEWLYSRDNKQLYRNSEGQYPDNLERYIYFCQNGINALVEMDFQPDIIHLHDWQAALVAPYLKTIFADHPMTKKAKIVFTIHNLAFQGEFGNEKFHLVGLDKKYYTADFLEFYQDINLMKGGIIFADKVTTVSPNYAKEILLATYGKRLEGVLAQRTDGIVGILNGIDYSFWNPAKDSNIAVHFSVDKLAARVENKPEMQVLFQPNETNKGKLLGELAIDKKAFVAGMVSRLTSQKGIKLLADAIEPMLKQGQVVILGLGDNDFEKNIKPRLIELTQKYKGKLAIMLDFDEALAHKVYAGIDVFLMPSKEEPCGLCQMIAMHYGAPPIVNPVGGLRDSVIDVEEGGNGFVMSSESSESLLKAYFLAKKLFGQKDKWQEVQKRGMNTDFSWKKAAKEWLALYREIREKPSLKLY